MEIDGAQRCCAPYETWRGLCWLNETGGRWADDGTVGWVVRGLLARAAGGIGAGIGVCDVPAFRDGFQVSEVSAAAGVFLRGLFAAGAARQRHRLTTLDNPYTL